MNPDKITQEQIIDISKKQKYDEAKALDLRTIKPAISKRLFCTFLELIILFFVCFLGSLGLKASPLGNQIRQYECSAIEYQDKTKVQYGIGYFHYLEEGESPKDKQVYEDTKGKYIVCDYAKEDVEKYAYKLESWQNNLNRNVAYQNNLTNSKWGNYILTISLSLVIFVIYYFVIPVIRKDKRTLCELIFKLQTIEYKSLRLPSWWRLFLNGFIFFLSIALFFIGCTYYAFLISTIIEVLFFIFSPLRRSYHDMLSGTFVCENKGYASYTKYKKNLIKPVENVTQIKEEN